MNDDQMIELDLGKHGPLKVKVAKKPSEDLHIAFTTENVEAFLLYMSEIGADCCIHGRRQYQSSGKYAKKAEWQGYGSVLEKMLMYWEQWAALYVLTTNCLIDII